ncbi:hypothetical protein [Fictibacillus phosphorivorans]|uniref:hypothetical protein n=1 Tax=Fictibacillus phosphorivorans TaxID=1221500 RepID=UPI00203FAB60|nr:hypothetical protein [Fictibacillus phosphorivorans]MCM3717662.1 hypothetical protein [Fictibacillus phosphorivorans]MCM3775562.1 hypothetical protein [Fictibacillus phosphorivorans]
MKERLRETKQIEGHMNRLNKIMDEQMSRETVFSEMDERNILREIHERKMRPVSRRRRPFVPALLTIALFAGLLLATVTYLDDYFQPKQQAIQKPNKPKIEDKNIEVKETEKIPDKNEVVVEEKKEDEDLDEQPVTYDAYFTDSNGRVEINKETGNLKIWGGFINLAGKESPPFDVKANILNPELEGALKELSFYFNDARNAQIQNDEVFEFEQEVPLLKGVANEDLKDKVHLSFIVNDQVVKTHVIEEITVIEKSETPVEETMKIEEIKRNLKRGMTQEEVIAVFGENYTPVRGAMNDENLWRRRSGLHVFCRS